MKSRILVLLAGIVILAMASCAGSPMADQEAPAAPAAAETPSVEAENQEPVAVWKVAEETVKSPDGTIDRIIEYQYSESGNISVMTVLDSREELLYRREYNYENGILVSLEIFDRYSLISTTIYENNDDGLVVRETKQDSEGNNLSMVTFEYQNGLITKSVAADGSGTPHLSALYEYEGDTVSAVSYVLPGGSEEARFERMLESGRVVEERTVLPDGTVETGRSFEYEGGMLIREEQYAGTSLTKSVGYEYDKDGNIIRETTYNRGGRAYEILERRWVLVEGKE